MRRLINAFEFQRDIVVKSYESVGYHKVAEVERTKANRIDYARHQE